MIELLLRLARRATRSSRSRIRSAEDDPQGFAALHPRGRRARCRSSATTSWSPTPRWVREAAARGAANAVLLKPNQRGTLTETRAAWDAAQAVGYAGIVSARSGETEDTTIVHLAVGWGVGQLKVGSFARGERMAKWNEALRIEERLGRARDAGASLAAPDAVRSRPQPRRR